MLLKDIILISVAKKWGTEEVYKWSDYGVKHISLDTETSMHMHPVKVETIIPVTKLTIRFLNAEIELLNGECLTIPAGLYHQMVGPSQYWEASTLDEKSCRLPDGV